VLYIVRMARGPVIQTANGTYRLNPKDYTISEYTGKSSSMVQNGLKIDSGGKTFAFPPDCKPLCSAGSQSGSMISVADCNGRVISALLETSGKVRSTHFTDGAIVGTCWAFTDSLSFSYYKPKKRLAYVNSFVPGNSSQRSFTTESLIVAAGKEHFALANGQVVKIPALAFHGAVPFQGGAVTYAPDVKGERIQGAWEGVKAVVDENGCLAVQSYDVHVVHGGGDDEYMTMHLAIIVVALVLAAGLLIASYRAKKGSFWE